MVLMERRKVTQCPPASSRDRSARSRGGMRRNLPNAARKASHSIRGTGMGMRNGKLTITSGPQC